MKKILLFAFTLFLFSQNTQAQLAGELGVLKSSLLTGINPNTGVAWVAGDQYRLIFVTSSSRNAQSTVIGDYNMFVQAAADGSSTPTLGNATWNVVGSTQTVDARTNTGTLGSGGFPTILIDGTTIIASDNDDFWDGHAVGTQDINLDENEMFVADGTRVFAGTTPSGAVVADRWFGTVIPSGPTPQLRVETGITNPNTTGRWIQQFNNPPSASNPFYALSDPLTVCALDSFIVDADMDGYADIEADTLFSCDPQDAPYVPIGSIVGPEVDCDPTDANLTTPGNPCTDDDQFTIEEFVNDDCECVAGAIIPTLSQWGIIALAMIMLILGLVFVRQRKVIFES